MKIPSRSEAESTQEIRKSGRAPEGKRAGRSSIIQMSGDDVWDRFSRERPKINVRLKSKYSVYFSVSKFTGKVSLKCFNRRHLDLKTFLLSSKSRLQFDVLVGSP